MKGRINTITGLMYSGKSTYLVDKYIELKEQGFTIDAYKPYKNKRGGEFIVSRDREVGIPCNMVADITEALQSKAEVIFIDEYQNFNKEQLKYTLKQLKEKGKIVYVAGLDKKAANTYWDNYEVLEKLSDRIETLKYKCQLCDAEADFSCLIKYGENKSFSTTLGAVYQNLCLSCSKGRNVLEK